MFIYKGKNIFMRNIIYLLVLISFVSCASVKDQSGSANLQLHNLVKPKLTSMLLNGKMSATMESRNYNFSYKMVIGHQDSIEMEVLGPFGVTVGKLFADNNNFTFLNSFENRIYKGKSSPENFKKAFRIMISVKELIALIRNSTPYPADQYLIFEEATNSNLFRRIDESGQFADFMIVNNEGITKFQRKETGNILTMNAEMTNFESLGGFNLAKTIDWSFPTASANLNIIIDKFTINPEGIKPKIFSYGKEMPVIDLDYAE